MLNKTLKAVNNDYNQEDFENLIEMFRRYLTLRMVLKFGVLHSLNWGIANTHKK